MNLPLNKGESKRYYTTAEAAKYLGVPAGTLRWWRKIDAGPKYYKPRARALYDVADLDAFVASGTRLTSSVRRTKETGRVAL